MKKGFTLIELLIVIGVLAVLATITVLVINPAERLREARDAQRLTDLKSLRDAINLYLTRASSPSLGLGCETGETSYPAWRAISFYPTVINSEFPADAQPFKRGRLTNAAESEEFTDISNIRKVNGTGWVSVNFEDLGGTSPISKLPIDPSDIFENDLSQSVFPETNEGLFYAYQCYGLTYEINANMESVKYESGGSRDVESNDGGTEACYGNLIQSRACNSTVANKIFEIGNDPGLDL